MIILRKRIAQKKEMSFQRSYNLINSVIPIISILSIILGGGSSFIYLKTLNAIDLLYTFNFMSFSIIAISW
ncbi:hypothetical protein, partial [Rodentibacter ratti]|uniref:hypothetical protein n=1 Tax=Rodentibacter ratti TaxID=1906745 RepID=UPI001C4DF42A